MISKLFILLSVAYSLGTQVAAQPAPAAPVTTPAPEDLGSIEGLVVNALSGEPVQKAVVSTIISASFAARGGAPAYTALGARPSAVSDASGRFTLAKLPPGRYALTARRNGFIQLPASGSNAATVARGQQVREIVLRLTPAGVLTGRVIDQDGEPVVRAQVRAMRHQVISGRRQLVAAAAEGTNDLGEYRLFDLAPGKYYVSASKSGVNDPAVDPSGQDYAITYYPGSTSIESASAVEVEAGQRIGGLDFRMGLTRIVSVSGRISGVQDFRNVVVMLTPRGINNAVPVASSTTVSPGAESFRLRGVKPGSYYLTARNAGGQTLQTARIRVEVGSEDIENLTISFGLEIEATGRVRVEGSSEPPPQFSLNLIPRDSGFAGEAPRVTKNPDGTFKIQSSGAEAYIVQVTAAAPVYIKRIQAGGMESAGPVLDLTGGSLGDVEIVLGSNPPELQGIVQDSDAGKAAAGALVVLVPREPEHRDLQYFYRQSITDANGRFRVLAPAPGKYTIYAWPEIESAYMEPEFTKLFEGKGVDVEAGEGESLSLKLPLLRATR